jgi:Spy/CpxP family protein refolding chaperone
MVNKIVVFSIFIAFFISFSAMAAPDSANAVQKEKVKKIFDDLCLNADQKAKLKDLRMEMQTIRKDHNEKMKDLREKIKDEILKDSPSKSALNGFAKDIGNLRAIMAEKEYEHLLKIKLLLTPEQFKKLLSKELWQGMGDGRENHHWGMDKER